MATVIGHTIIRVPNDKPHTDVEETKKILELEMFLNQEIAQVIYEKFSFGFRVHLGEFQEGRSV